MAGKAGNLLFSRFIFQTPLKSGFVCAAMIKEQKQKLAAIMSAARVLVFIGSSPVES
jgi:hypothetical protein